MEPQVEYSVPERSAPGGGGPEAAGEAGEGCVSVLADHGSVGAYVQRLGRAGSRALEAEVGAAAEGAATAGAPPRPTASGPLDEVIARLEVAKAEAATREDFEAALRHKKDLTRVRELAEAIAQLEVKKKEAAACEDYAVAAAAKREIEELLASANASTQAREEAEYQAREKAERQAREKAERQAKEEAERQAREEAERQAREEAERHAKEEAERRKKKEAELQAERRAREDAERRARAEAGQQTREAARASRLPAEECPICFEELPSAPTAVLMCGGRRVCRHFFHDRCANSLVSPSGRNSCPCCRAEYDGVQRVPDVQEEPRRWFELVDTDGNGSLDQCEVIEVLKATLRVDHVRLEQDLPMLFCQWDPNGDGKVEYEEMMGPHGLFFYVRDAFRATGQASSQIPNIRTDRRAWFRYWDEDGSGSLDQEEVVRSFVKTFGLSSNLEQVQLLRELLGVLWTEFDPDGSGDIDADEFCRPGEGLADMVIANLGV